jgi:hypothetical protein
MEEKSNSAGSKTSSWVLPSLRCHPPERALATANPAFAMPRSARMANIVSPTAPVPLPAIFGFCIMSNII